MNTMHCAGTADQRWEALLLLHWLLSPEAGSVYQSAWTGSLSCFVSLFCLLLSFLQSITSVVPRSQHLIFNDMIPPHHHRDRPLSH